MSDKLIFPIGFDLDEGVKEASKQWKSTYRKQMQDAIDKNPIKVKIDFESKGIDTKEFKQWMVLSREAEKLERERIKNAKEWQKIADQQAMAETRRANAINESNARIERANRKAEASEQRKRNNLERTNDAYKKQSTYLNRLFQRMIAYASVAQAFSMLRNIREITAEFELQRVALGSIIGDLNEANKMFEQIKAAAVKSPFQIKELVSYTKQLAAYKIETDELFETTQRLADISAGLGVGMERLVLAYGQIRATGFLRASEVRQLTEAGVPIVEELAKKMSELRGETVRASEVMQLISEPAISFGMVKEVFDDMTSAGGMFYKMQEKQAETLAGQWSNLQDAVAIMYDEIGNTEGVNNAMKGIIGLIKSMAENWRVGADVVKSVIAGMLTYKIAMKSAAAASVAMAASEARLAALEMTREARMPRLIKMFLTQNAQIKVTIALNKALVFAQQRALMATTALSKGFWKLTTAMLSNPYTVILAALTAIGVAIWQFSRKVKTTEEYVGDLNKSLSSFNELAAKKNSVKTLIEEFNTLNKKTNKTTQEQKRLTQVTQQLADKFPSAITAINEYGKSVEIAASKVNDLYKAELAVSTQGLRASLSVSESQLAKLEKDYADTQNKIISGTKKVFRINENGVLERRNVDLSIEEVAELYSKLNKLESEMSPLRESIKQTKIALGELPDENKAAIDSFGSWKKTIQEFKTGLKNLKGEDVPLYEDDIINQFKNLNDAIDKTVEKYKEYDDAIQKYSKILTNSKLNQSEIDEINRQIQKATAFRDTAKSILEYYNSLHLLDKKTTEGSELSKMQKELQIQEKILAKYNEYRKYMSNAQAEAKTRDYFKDVIDSLKFTPQFDSTKFKELLKEYQDYIRTLPESDKLVMDIDFKIGDIDFQDYQDSLKSNLARLQQEIAQTKEAKEFYDKIFGLSGNKDLAMSVTLSVYGTTGDDLAQKTAEQLRQAFGSIDISSAINPNNFAIDWNIVRKVFTDNQDIMGETSKKSVQEMISNEQQLSKARIESWAKDLESVKSYADKRIALAEYTQKKIAEIEGSNEDDDKKQELINEYRKREAKETSKLQFEAFKDESFSNIFSNLEGTSTTMLENLRDNLIKFKSQLKDITEIKEVEESIQRINDQLASRNPFKTITESIATMKSLGSKSELEDALSSAIEKRDVAQQQFNLHLAQQTQYEEEYQSLLSQFGKDDARVKSAKESVELAKKDVQLSKDKLNSAEGEVDVNAKKYKQLTQSQQNIVSSLQQISQYADVATKSVTQIYNAFGNLMGDDIDAEFFNSIASGINDTAQGVTSLVGGIMSGNPIAIISGIGQAIQGISSLAVAGKIKRANREIARQQRTIENLEYSYQRLEKAQETALGGAYVQNYKTQLKNLEAQQTAYLKQAEAERSKGKKSDSDKIKEYEEQARDVADKIKDMQGELQEYFLGTDLTSAAQDFANAWIDAYKEFGSTSDAMRKKFDEMIQNMVVNSIAGNLMKNLLKPVFDEIDNALLKDDDLSINEISKISKMVPGIINKMNQGMTQMVDSLAKSGYDIRNTGGELKGISRELATASEESILGLAAGINTQNYYISYVPMMHTEVQIIRSLLQGGAQVQQGGFDMQSLITIQNQHLSYLPNIAANTADTVARCERAAMACERVADNLDRVIKPRGVQSTHVVNTAL